MIVYNMKDFIVQHILHSNLLHGNDFMNLTNTCKQLRVHNNGNSLKRLWKHGKVNDIRTALYVEHKLNQYTPYDILAEAPSAKEKDVVSALRKLISPTDMRYLSKAYNSPKLFLLERITPIKSLLGKRSKRYT